MSMEQHWLQQNLCIVNTLGVGMPHYKNFMACVMEKCHNILYVTTNCV